MYQTHRYFTQTTISTQGSKDTRIPFSHWTDPGATYGPSRLEITFALVSLLDSKHLACPVHQYLVQDSTKREYILYVHGIGTQQMFAE